MAHFQVRLGGEWRDCSPEQDRALKRAFQAGRPRLQVSLRGQSYEFDFRSMLQKNVETGKVRDIRPPRGWGSSPRAAAAAHAAAAHAAASSGRCAGADARRGGEPRPHQAKPADPAELAGRRHGRGSAIPAVAAPSVPAPAAALVAAPCAPSSAPVAPSAPSPAHPSASPDAGAPAHWPPVLTAQALAAAPARPPPMAPHAVGVAPAALAAAGPAEPARAEWRGETVLDLW